MRKSDVELPKICKRKCSIHGLEPIPCIDQNPQGCIEPHPNPGVHVVYMCPICWAEWQQQKRRGGFRW